MHPTKKILITGAKGTIGTVLTSQLSDYELTLADLPEIDIRDYNQILKIARGHEMIIHLAWDTHVEHYKSGRINPENVLMTYNVYQAALEAGVRRVIMASSVHADTFLNWKAPPFLSVERVPTPDSPYGASKVFMESLGRYYAQKGLEVVCIRFMGLNKENKPSLRPEEKGLWFSHNDCGVLVKKCIESESVPNKYVIIYGVSSNADRIHDYQNPFGWIPQDGAKP